MIYKLYAVLLIPAVKAMNGNRGKMVTQGGHAFVHALWDAEDRFPDAVAPFRGPPSAFKIALAIDDETALRALADRYGSICGVSLVEERGAKADGSVNEAARGVTGLGIGPIREDQIDDDLRLLKGFV